MKMRNRTAEIEINLNMNSKSSQNSRNSNKNDQGNAKKIQQPTDITNENFDLHMIFIILLSALVIVLFFILVAKLTIYIYDSRNPEERQMALEYQDSIRIFGSNSNRTKNTKNDQITRKKLIQRHHGSGYYQSDHDVDEMTLTSNLHDGSFISSNGNRPLSWRSNDSNRIQNRNFANNGRLESNRTDFSDVDNSHQNIS